jgi:hypothetical protein
MPLSPILYDLLEERLPGGVLRVTDPGMAASLQEVYDVVGKEIRPTIKVASPGERYICRCIFCDDRSGHLYVNHLYGRWSTHTNSYMTHLVKCFRSDCLADCRNRKHLADVIFSGGAVCGEDLVLREGIKPDCPDKLVPIKPPGQMIALSKLYLGHPARTFLTNNPNRRYDIRELEDVFQVAYCVDSPNSLLVGRLYIPLFMDGKLVYWQMRWANDLNWKETSIKKYLNLDKPVKRLTLYNYDVARTQPLVVVCEGATDVWAVGKPGVALLGKHASGPQLDLLAANWGDRCIVILLDADDPDAAKAAEKLRKQLLSRPDVKAPVLDIRLPDGYDPGDCARDDLWSYLRCKAKEQGYSLPDR